MKIAIVGGGPGGLYFAALAKQLDPNREVTVWERNAADDTFGFGVVFSDETLEGITNADAAVFSLMERDFARWSDIDVCYRGTTQTSSGHGFAAIERKRLLQILQRRCHDVGVDVRFSTEAPDVEQLAAEYDLVIAADGVNSAIRRRFEDVFRPSLDVRESHYMWLATDRVLEAFTFVVEETEFGPVQVHAYPISADRSTFIVEVNDRTWRRAGFTDGSFGPGVSDTASVERCHELLRGFLGDAELLTNNSKWLRFTTVRNETWRHGNVVLLGDAAHTAHFSIGSGTKLAMEDALALAAALETTPGDLPAALAHYEAERRPVVESTQRAAQASLEWFETIDHVVGQEPPQFAFNLLTRSRRVTYDNLRLRDPEYIRSLDRWFSENTAGGRDEGTPPLFQPFDLAGQHLRNRIVAAPVTTYSAVDGVPGEAELLHLSGKALGGAGLVFTGMTAVTARGRVTPACPGLYTDEQARAWRRVTAAVHAHSGALIGVQLSHSGPKGSTTVPDRGPLGGALTANGWRTVAPSPLAYGNLPVPHELSEEELQDLVDDFAAAARRADSAGFDVLELQAGHGFLLSAFLSPLTNHRTDAYGGDLEARLRFPLAVVAAVRAGWPRYKPFVVRISAVDWAEGGTTIEDSVRVAAALAAHGVDAIDVSSGEVVAFEKPAFGRSYQTPFAERIRADVGIPTIAVGGISTCDDANSIVLAGRADLAGIGRAHLHDPSWSLHAATELGYSGPGAYWPPIQAGGETKPPSGGRARPLLTLHAKEPSRTRWTPVAAGTRDRSV
ncbi:FAD-dependent monooxygenase [Amycolatopsis rhabdoformis]|uniref:FAD-dependent monooxygenase n=1 Tax=Amycolatopsis rhabdoformis TaxID=1448059 RepID=A0ABZ1HWD7_9PSEU|nr:FAD-dependent monooxygenase [Amycolatopsis rhabdoformis]WSE26184.1 FAD-dependent monooxygenase [Amycolatopsis rhabdoformis]